MSKNNNSFTRYKVLDRCFRDNIHRYFIEDLISECEKEFKSSGIAAKVSRRQIFEDIRFMESEEGWGIKLNRLKDGKRIYYRYEKGGSKRNSSLTEMETMQLQNALNTLERFRAMTGYEWVNDVIVNLEYRLGLKEYGDDIISFEKKGKGVTKLSAILDLDASLFREEGKALLMSTWDQEQIMSYYMQNTISEEECFAPILKLINGL